MFSGKLLNNVSTAAISQKQGSNSPPVLVGRLHHRHHDKWPQSCLCHLWSGSHLAVRFKERLVRLGASVLASPFGCKMQCFVYVWRKGWLLKSPLLFISYWKRHYFPFLFPRLQIHGFPRGDRVPALLCYSEDQVPDQVLHRVSL